MGTVEKTIASLEGRCTMTDKERFEGMKARAIAENEEHYGPRYADVTEMRPWTRPTSAWPA
ncbi:MAG: hypothetical protein ACLUW6_09585 [Coriobacteriaceae bacterium]